MDVVIGGKNVAKNGRNFTLSKKQFLFFIKMHFLFAYVKNKL